MPDCTSVFQIALFTSLEATLKGSAAVAPKSDGSGHAFIREASFFLILKRDW